MVKKHTVTGGLIGGGLFIGMGIGWIFDQFIPGLFIGLGAGIVLSVIMNLIRGKW